MSYGTAADSVYQQAKSRWRGSQGAADDKLFAMIGDNLGNVRVSQRGDHVWVRYLGYGTHSELYPDTGDLMIARNTTGIRFEAGDMVNVVWMDDGGASMLKISERRSIVLRRLPLNCIAHVGGIDKADPDGIIGSGSIEFAPPRLASVWAIRPPTPNPDDGPFPIYRAFQGVCGHPTEYHSYLAICMYRGQVIEVKRGMARPVAGLETNNPLTAGGEDEEGKFAFGVSVGDVSVTIAPRGVVADAAGNIYVLCNPPVGGNSSYIGTFQIGGTWSWVFGMGEDGYSGDGGPSREATGCVAQMALDEDGSLYLTDPFHHVVRKIPAPITGTTSIQRIAGYDPLTGPPTPLPTPPVTDPLATNLYQPQAITIDQQSDDLYFSDLSGLVYKISGGSISVYIGPDPLAPYSYGSPPSMAGQIGHRVGMLVHALSLAFGADGALYLIHGVDRRLIAMVHGPVNVPALPEGSVEWLAGYTQSDESIPIPSLIEAVTSPSQSSTKFPFPQAPINLALSLSFDLSGDLYFVDSRRLVVRKMVDDDRWVTLTYGSPGLDRTMAVFRPDGTYMRTGIANSATGNGVGGAWVAELDTNKKLVGIAATYLGSSTGFNEYKYQLFVLVYEDANPNGRYYPTGYEFFPFYGEALPPPYPGISPSYHFGEFFAANMSSGTMVFNKVSATGVEVYRVMPVNPPPNTGGSRYTMEWYDTLEVPAPDIWLSVNASGTYGSIVYIMVQRLYNEDLNTHSTTLLQMYDGKVLADAGGFLGRMGLSSEGLQAFRPNWLRWYVQAADLAASVYRVGFSNFERLRDTEEAGAYGSLPASINTTFPDRNNVQFGRVWRTDSGFRLSHLPPFTGGVHEFGEPQYGETYNVVDVYDTFGGGGKVRFVMLHGPSSAPGSNPGFSSFEQAIGSQYLLFTGGGEAMTMGLWAATPGNGLFLVFSLPSIFNPQAMGRFYILDEAVKFNERIGG